MRAGGGAEGTPGPSGGGAGTQILSWEEYWQVRLETVGLRCGPAATWLLTHWARC